jgi:hypothetical protein
MLSFPKYNGKDDPMGWLNHFDQSFRAQHMHQADKV